MATVTLQINGYAVTAELADAAAVQDANMLHFRHGHYNDFKCEWRDYLPAWKADKLWVLRIPGRSEDVCGDIVGYYIAFLGAPMFTSPVLGDKAVARAVCDSVLLSQ